MRKDAEKVKIKDGDITAVIVIAILLSVVLAVVAGIISVRNNAKRALNTFSTNVEDVSDSITDMTFNIAEHNYHVSNKLATEIGNIVETSKLEVLRVNDTEFITDINDKDQTTTSWLQVDGEGVFTIELNAAEYVYDMERNTITVVVPYPELTSCRVTGAKNLLFKNNSWFNGSYENGEDLALKQIQAGYLKLHDYISDNAQFLKSAKSSGERLIKNLINQLYDEGAINVEVIYKRINEE